MTENSDDVGVKYLPFQSVIDQSFWHKLFQLKLDIDRLEESERNIWGLHLQPGLSVVFVDYSSFNSVINWKLDNCDYSLQSLCSSDSKCNFPLVPLQGVHKNFNTLDNFKAADKNATLASFGIQIRDDIISGRALTKPSLLTRFILLTFCDLKHFEFYYWFSFPACLSVQASFIGDSSKLKDLFTESQIKDLFSSHEALPREKNTVFGISFDGDKTKCITLEDLVQSLNSGLEETSYLCYLDSSTDAKYPGWPLRNILALLTHHWKNAETQPLKIISFRIGPHFLDSPVYKVSMKVTDKKMVKWVGWEKNTRDKLGPRFTSLKETMDPKRLADNSAKLNLKLMKWRLAPELNLEIISNQKVLILGAGTLGCALARNLMCWGIKNITFVDNGSVSYSNPVRQCLYTITDCLKEKAPAAAEALITILPTVNATGEVLEIPMPGHSTASLSNAERLHELIQAHDAVFLVTDSRESRWLPTLIAASLGKIAITTALGFDTYLIIRHGHSDDQGTEKLACYFCNDVTAPGNSTSDRTLDQQCTVSRPGVSNIAAAFASELFVSLLQTTPKVISKQHSSSSDATTNNPSETECVLGLIPHSIRGFLSSFSHILPKTTSFSKCIACSSVVIDHYNRDRTNFLTQVFDSNTFLEEVTGLTELQKLTGEIEDFMLSDEGELQTE